MFPNFEANLDVIIAPKTATIWITKMLIINPDVFCSGVAQFISCSPK